MHHRPSVRIIGYWAIYRRRLRRPSRRMPYDLSRLIKGLMGRRLPLVMHRARRLRTLFHSSQQSRLIIHRTPDRDISRQAVLLQTTCMHRLPAFTKPAPKIGLFVDSPTPSYAHCGTHRETWLPQGKTRRELCETRCNDKICIMCNSRL